MTDEEFENEHRSWVVDLQALAAALRDGHVDVTHAVTVYCNTVFKINDGLGWIVGITALPEKDEAIEILEESVVRMRDLVGPVMDLSELLAGSIRVREEVVSHAEIHARSWAEIVLKALEQVAVLSRARLRPNLTSRSAVESLVWAEYNSKYVEVQLDIEFEQIRKRLFTADGKKPIGNAKTPKRRGPTPDPEKDRIEEQYRRMGKGAKYSDIAEILDLKKWGGRFPDKRVERVVNAMQQRERR